MQRLAIAKVLYHKPRFAILDESVCALDKNNIKLLYRLLLESKTTLISLVNQPSSLYKFHKYLLLFSKHSPPSFSLIPNNKLQKQKSHWKLYQSHTEQNLNPPSSPSNISPSPPSQEKEILLESPPSSSSKEKMNFGWRLFKKYPLLFKICINEKGFSKTHLFSIFFFQIIYNLSVVFTSLINPILEGVLVSRDKLIFSKFLIYAFLVILVASLSLAFSTASSMSLGVLFLNCF